MNYKFKGFADLADSIRQDSLNARFLAFARNDTRVKGSLLH